MIIPIFLFYWFNLSYNKIDRCLDKGGKWNYQTRMCEYEKIKNDQNVTYLSGWYYPINKTDDNPYGEIQKYDSCIIMNIHNRYVVVDKHLKNISFENTKIAVLEIDSIGPAYINKLGKIVLMHRFENGPDYFAEGLARNIVNKKIGFVNKELNTVIEPKFDAAFPFKNGRAKVGINCKKVKMGEHSKWECKEWFWIDKNGNRL